MVKALSFRNLNIIQFRREKTWKSFLDICSVDFSVFIEKRLKKRV